MEGPLLVYPHPRLLLQIHPHQHVHQNYIHIVDGLLRLSNATHLRRLHFDFFICRDGPPFPDQWLRFVAGLSSVTDLIVCFHGNDDWNPNIDRFGSALDGPVIDAGRIHPSLFGAELLLRQSKVALFE
ncbi:hypothetical protein QJS10_CPA16g01130 [Acorus calamus]|uniref:Uncharacterized protein n=1 Tax=Acorus calamus TaxID=4465 RepID=A0AAV9D3A9_ACOCL|nr:hypothetical protein QJS10_CPA16g01130 [Acorus calamus]